MAKKTLIGALAIAMASAITLPHVAFAAPLTQPNQSRAIGFTGTGDVNIEPVAWKKKKYYGRYNKRWHGDRYRYRHGGYRHYHNGWYYNNPWWLAAPFVAGAVVGAYAAPRVYYDNDYGGGHVEWCLNRYRSYDPRTNTFLGYDGYRHECNSPY
jgi:hypothetical protein